MDDPVTIFFNSYFPPVASTPPNQMSQSHFRRNCRVQPSFFSSESEDEESKPASFPGNLFNGDPDPGPKRMSDPNEDQDGMAYTYFDRLWISSRHHQSLLYDQWKYLLDKVEQQGIEYNFNLGSDHVTGILYLCKTLRTNFVVKFRALELYNRYLTQFSRKHEEILTNSTEKEEEEFRARFESQVFLRICTCILIASKLHADTQIRALTTEKIREILVSEGFVKFTCCNIASSEMRVLEALNYKCLWITPLEMVEQLLGILNLPLDVLKRAHYFCILLLEFSYTDLGNIRDRFMLKCAKNSQPFTPASGRITMPLRTAAIVAAALFIVSTETKKDLHKAVAKTANLNEDEVHCLAVILLDLLNVP